MKKVRRILAPALFTAAAAVAVFGSSRSAAQHVVADRKVYQPAFSVAAIVTHDAALAGVHDIELQGELAFVAGKGGSLAVLGIKNPRSP